MRVYREKVLQLAEEIYARKMASTKTGRAPKVIAEESFREAEFFYVIHQKMYSENKEKQDE